MYPPKTGRLCGTSLRTHIGAGCGSYKNLPAAVLLMTQRIYGAGLFVAMIGFKNGFTIYAVVI
jgi:hypothetical protein